jgi:hypothetical protein
MKKGDKMQILDYTKLRLNKKLRIVKCPKCNRKGELHRYIDKSAMIIHKSHIELGMFNNIDDSCEFKSWEV